MIGKKLFKNNEEDMKSYTQFAIWCNENKATIIDKDDYYEIVALKDFIEEIPIEQKALIVKNSLQNLAVNAMMMTLAGNSITTQQSEYQRNITNLSDDVALLIPEVYPVWSADSVEYKKDDRVTYNGVLYKVLTDHTSQPSWTPTDAPSLFVKVLTSDNEILDWEQPSADNAYMKGDKVRYNGKVYESLIDNNVWAPDAYPEGWKEIEVA